MNEYRNNMTKQNSEGTDNKNTVRPWWKQAAAYQIYPKSFQDSNGDGIGDLQGIIRRLPYLEKLGIDAIWLSPVCRSPQEDNGYDISDYQDIDPMFGTMADMEQLIAEADRHGIKIILDLVLNHTSMEHRWFKEARKSKENPYHDYYVWRDGVEGILPNDMRATFGGPAWDWCPDCGQYYFHQFAVGQPDLNWDNPKVREELYQMIRFWMEKGVGGFRLDVIDQIAKEPDWKITANGPRLHEYLQELNRETFGGQGYLTVGEAWGANLDNAPLYSNPDDSEFSMVFQFEHIGLDNQPGCDKWDYMPLDLVRLKEVLSKWQTALYQRGWNSLFWNNHDLPRIVSRWGNDGAYRVESAKMLATLLYGMQGTTFMFQGEELGMTNAYEFTKEDYRDIETLNLYEERLAAGYPLEHIMDSLHKRSRDNARTPMQWDTSKNAGFTEGIPWIPMNANYTEINAEAALADPNSIFYYYQKLIALRKEYEVFTEGKYELLLPESSRIFAYSRTWGDQKLIVVANFYEEELWLSEYEKDLLGADRDALKLIGNYDAGHDGLLRPYEARMCLI